VRIREIGQKWPGLGRIAKVIKKNYNKAMENSTQNPTEANSKELTLGAEYVVENKEQTQKREDQERTKIKKRLFLEHYSKSFGVVTVTCEKIGIDRCTFYEWRDHDPDFAEALQKTEDTRNDVAEDLLFVKMHQLDGASIRFYLERKNPAYRQKIINEVYAGARTWEDLIDDAKAHNAEIIKKQNDGQLTAGGQPDADREQPVHTDEARTDGAVQTQQSPAVLLGAQDKTQPDIKSEAKGIE